MVAEPVLTAQALLAGLRRPRDEAQLTQAIAGVARADPGFADAFVNLLLDTAERYGHGEKVRRLRAEPIPRLTCRAEQNLRDIEEISLGRVDLRFDGDAFTLFVENKLYSGYGAHQIQRYLRALARLPPERRSALLAVTRSVPTYGEPTLNADDRWLGSVRWIRLQEQLRALPIADARLQEQWRLFVDLLDQQGDLGMTHADSELIRAWGKYLEGRKHLVDVLDQVWSRSLEKLEGELRQRYSKQAKGEALVAIHARGKRRQVVQRDQTRVFLSFRIPARVKDSSLYIQFSNYFGVPHFTIEARPWDAERLLDERDRRFLSSTETLESAGYQTDGRTYWAKVHEPQDYLEAEDLPSRLLELIDQDIEKLVGSGILDNDVDSTINRKVGGPPRYRRVPEAPVAPTTLVPR